jgi:hypothetical protein
LASLHGGVERQAPDLAITLFGEFASSVPAAGLPNAIDSLQPSSFAYASSGRPNLAIIRYLLPSA